ARGPLPRAPAHVELVLRLGDGGPRRLVAPPPLASASSDDAVAISPGPRGRSRRAGDADPRGREGRGARRRPSVRSRSQPPREHDPL
ncbi:hypothetical protein ACHAWF_014734, partial [Thalassiosira exigua]